MIFKSIEYTTYTGTDPQPGFCELYVNTENDLPTVAAIQTAGNVDPLAGSVGIACDTGQKYLLDENGAWHKVQGETFANVYTEAEVDALLAGKQDTLTITSSISQGSTDVITAGGAYDAVYYIANNGFLPASADLNDASYQTPGRWYYTQGNASTFGNRPNHANFIASIDGGNPAPGMLEFIQVYKSGNVTRGIQRIYISGVRFFMRGYQKNDASTPPTITWYGWNVFEGTATGSLP